MTLMSRLLRGVLKAALGVVAILFVMVLGVVLFVAFTPVGGRIAADRVSDFISTPDRKVTFTRPEGLLTGDLKIETLTLSDDVGPYAQIDGLQVDWSPGSLITGVFRADSISADTINFIRPPRPSLTPDPKSATTSSSSGSPLPLGIQVAQLDLPDVNLSQALSGRDFSLAVKGSVNATGPNIVLDLEATRKDEPNARASADIVYAPSENRLNLKAALSEPQGGLLAMLLRLPGAPAVDLALDGEGPLSNWSGKLTGSVDNVPVIAVDGKHLTVENGRNRIEVRGGGQFATLLPPAVRPLFGGTTKIDIAATYAPSGRVDIERGELTSGAVKVAAKGAWDPTGDNSLTGSLNGTNGPVDFIWPISGQESRFAFESVNFTLNGAASSARFNATASLSEAQVPQGRFGQIRLQAESEDLDLVSRSGSIRSRVTIGRTWFVNADLDRIVRGPVTLDAPLRLAPNAIGLDAATFDTQMLNGTLSGAYDTARKAIAGNFRIAANPAALPPSLPVRFDGKLSAEGYVNAVSGGRMSLENFVLRSSTIEAHGNASLENQHLSLKLAGRLPDLKRWLAEAEGAAGFDISAKGPLAAPGIRAVVNSADARLVGRRLQDMSLLVEGKADRQAPNGKIAATGSLDGQPVKINADIVSADGRTNAPAIAVEVGPNRLNGSLDLSAGFLPQGKIDFDFPDISMLAALAAQQAQGDLRGTVLFNRKDGKAEAAVRASGSAVRRTGVEISKPDIDLTIPDIKVLAASGYVRAARIGTGAVGVDNIDLGLTQQGNLTRFNLAAQYDNAPLTLLGDIETGASLSVGLERFEATPRNIPIRLANPTRIAVADGGVRLDGLALATGGGSVTVKGVAGSRLDVSADIRALPASLINSFAPSINAVGTISGTISATGTPSAPAINYDLEWSDAQLRQTRDAGIPPFRLDASGSFYNGTVDLKETRLKGAGGLDLSATGRIILKDGVPGLDINARANAVPASLVNAFVPSLGARGTISGTVTATGTPADPAVRYDLRWANAGVTQTASAGIASVDVTATGTFRNETLTIDTRVSGGGGISLTGNGSVSLSGDKPLNLRLDGQLPFSILAGQLAAQGFILQGTGNVDIAVQGTVATPAISGTATSSGARLIDVRRNLAVTDLEADIGFNGNSATISRLTGKLSGGGTVSVQGTVGIASGSDFPADLRIALAQAAYADGETFAVTADGALTLTGPLVSGPALGGQLTLTKAAITVPARLPTSLSEIDIRHRNAPADVLRQVKQLRPKEASGASEPISLNLRIAAPNGIFVRGRGIDAELGGDLTVGGTAVAPIIGGGFQMRRGRIVILAKRLDFTNGDITFGGGLIPVLSMEANTTSAGTTITVKVTGVANDPEIAFSSSPALPQDEVLARLIFGQSMSRLSPLQIAQLADAVTQLSGGGSTSLLETLRSNLGVDDLDIKTDETGQTTVSVGRYINNRTYIQVEQGGQAGAQATINLDVGRGVKLKAGAGTGGGTAGIFYEKEY